MYFIVAITIALESTSKVSRLLGPAIIAVCSVSLSVLYVFLVENLK